MTTSAATRGWGPGWPNCQASKMVTLVRSDGLRIPVRAELVDLTAMLMDLTELLGYNLVPGWCWGFACRAISGTDVPSNHSWGLADDINAPNNPYASAQWHQRNARGTKPFGLQLVCDIPQSVIELWEGHGYGWGGRYRTKPDPMHLEWLGTPADAARITARLRKFLTDNGGPPPPPPEEIVDYDKVRDIVREEVDASLASRGLVEQTPEKKGGAIGELRRNVRKTAAAAGVPADDIER